MNIVSKIGLISLLMMGVFVSQSWGDTVGCELNLTPILTDAQLAASFDKILRKDPNILKGIQIPKWQDFQDLEQLNLELMRYYARVENPQAVLKIHAELTGLENHLSSVESLKPLFQRSYEELPSNYMPTEYELKILFRERLEKVMSQLPQKIQFKLPPIPKNKTTVEKLVFWGEVMVSRQDKQIDAIMKAKANRTLEEELLRIDEVAKKLPEDDIDRKIYESLKDPEQTDFAIRRPQTARWWVPKVGFHNQRVTGTSRGCLSTSSRNCQEAFSLGFDLEEYSKLDVDIMPKYGFLYHKNEALNFSRAGAEQYGEDIYILKKEKVKKRTTFTPRDSLGKKVAEAWDNRFTPVEHLTLASKHLTRDGLWRNEKYVDPLIDYWAGGSSYIELQYFGALRLEHVEKLIFENKPPSGEFLEELKKHSIQILDGRQGAPVPWVEGTP